MDQVAQNRTTIVIAHRLSTIKHADNIAVVAKGSVVQQGTHESLLRDPEGAYWKLVNAQQLATAIAHPAHKEIWSEKKPNRESILLEKESYETLVDSEATAIDEDDEPVKASKPSIMTSLKMLLVEQRRNRLGYIIIPIAAMGAAGECLGI